MNNIDDLRLTKDETPYIQMEDDSSYQVHQSIAEAQLAKALFGFIHKWLPAWLAEHHPSDECGGECLCTRRDFVEGLINKLAEDLKQAGIEWWKR